MPFIQLKTPKHIRKAGTLRTYRPGDWVDVGKQTALAWIAEGSAVDPADVTCLSEDILQKRSGVVVRGERGKVNLEVFKKFGNLLRFTYGPPTVRYEHTLIWDPLAPIGHFQVLLGFSRIQKTREEYDSWEIAAMLASSTTLARDIGSTQERRRTQEVVGDLRLPVYSTKAIWVRKTPSAQQTIERWASALAEGQHPQHAFLRALYAEQPLICTLPGDWFSGRKF